MFSDGVAGCGISGLDMLIRHPGKQVSSSGTRSGLKIKF